MSDPKVLCPCPKCGGEVLLYAYDGDTTELECWKCKAEFDVAALRPQEKEEPEPPHPLPTQEDFDKMNPFEQAKTVYHQQVAKAYGWNGDLFVLPPAKE